MYDYQLIVSLNPNVIFAGVRNSFLSPLPSLYESGNAPENASRRSNPVSVHPMLMDDTKPPLEVSVSSYIGAN